MKSVLEFNKYFVVVELVHDLAEDYVFHRLTGNNVRETGSWLAGLVLSPFLKTAVTLACCQS